MEIWNRACQTGVLDIFGHFQVPDLISDRILPIDGTSNWHNDNQKGNACGTSTEIDGEQSHLYFRVARDHVAWVMRLPRHDHPLMCFSNKPSSVWGTPMMSWKARWSRDFLNISRCRVSSCCTVSASPATLLTRPTKVSKWLFSWHKVCDPRRSYDWGSMSKKIEK